MLAIRSIAFSRQFLCVSTEHNRSFTVEVTACCKTWSATAGSKREGERLAALKALEELTSK